MSDGSDPDANILERFGLHPVTEGEHLDAWTAFWGVDIKYEEQSVWKQWLDALEPHQCNISIRDAAAAVGVLQDSDSEVIPPCTFLSTPWKSTLSQTDGRIMVTEDYKRLEAQVFEYIYVEECRDVAIAGQSGLGRTYFSHFLLARALARRQNMIFFTCRHVVVFSSSGVFSGDKLNVDFVYYDKFNKNIGGRPLVLVDVAQDDDEPGSLETMHPSIRVYPPSSRSFEGWMERIRPAALVLDALPASLVVSAAVLQRGIDATRSCLQRILACLRIAGPNLHSCFFMDPSALHTSLWDYIASLSLEQLAELAERAQFSTYSVRIARQGSGPDIFLLRRDITTYEACLPTIASRDVIRMIGMLHGLPGLSVFKNMEVIRRGPDGFTEIRRWLFEHMCHTLLSDGSSEVLAQIRLSQCFPSSASRRKGALKPAHLCTPRVLRAFDPRSPPPFDTTAYHSVETLVDGTLHAMIHARPHATAGSIKPQDKPSLEQKHKLRPRTRAQVTSDARRSKRRRLPAERRFVVFLQVVVESFPQLTDDGLRRVEKIMHADAEAEYFFVFMTSRDHGLDLSAIPPHWLGLFKWYHLSANVTTDLPGDRSESQSRADTSSSDEFS